MDIFLFPMLSEALKEHHKAVVTRHMFSFALVPVWIIAAIFFEKRKNRLAELVFGSAIIATVIFAFTALPFIWFAYIFPPLASVFLFLHDYGLYVYFVISVSLLVYKYFQKHYKD